MRQGVVFSAQLKGGDTQVGQSQLSVPAGLAVLASIPHPSHATLADVDQDGIKDLLVGDMGAFFPADHNKGAVIWLRGNGQGQVRRRTWLDGWPRVADVEAADFNGDGKNDLAVAAFGWRKTGQVAILENKHDECAAGRPSRRTRSIRARAASTSSRIDLNSDGEDGPRRAARAGARDGRRLHQHRQGRLHVRAEGDLRGAAPELGLVGHPARRSRQGRRSRRPAHARRYVRRRRREAVSRHPVAGEHGAYPFVEHTLAQMPGVHRAEAADIDGDGDLDIVACALLAGGSDVDESTLPALVWLEQTKPGVFARHTIEMGDPRHATLESATSTATATSTSSSATSRSRSQSRRGSRSGRISDRAA